MGEISPFKCPPFRNKCIWVEQIQWFLWQTLGCYCPEPPICHTHKAPPDVDPRNQAHNTPSPQHSSFEQTKFVSPGSMLEFEETSSSRHEKYISFQFPDSHCVYSTDSQIIYSNKRAICFMAAFCRLRTLSWNSFHSEPDSEYCIEIYGHRLQAQLAKNLRNLYLLHIFSGSKCVDKVVRGPDGGAGPDGRQSHGDPYQVQELRQDQLQLHQLRPAVLWRPAAGARHGDGQLGQARGARREGRVTGGKQKILNVLLNISWLVTLLSVTRVTVGSSVSPHVTSWCHANIAINNL